MRGYVAAATSGPATFLRLSLSMRVCHRSTVLPAVWVSGCSRLPALGEHCGLRLAVLRPSAALASPAPLPVFSACMRTVCRRLLQATRIVHTMRVCSLAAVLRPRRQLWRRLRRRLARPGLRPPRHCGAAESSRFRLHRPATEPLPRAITPHRSDAGLANEAFNMILKPHK